jgi:hypothetical protein
MSFSRYSAPTVEQPNVAQKFSAQEFLEELRPVKEQRNDLADYAGCSIVGARKTGLLSATFWRHPERFSGTPVIHKNAGTRAACELSIVIVFGGVVIGWESGVTK